MSKLDLKAIRARCDAATPGPWLIVEAKESESDLCIFTRRETGYGLGVVWGSLAEYEDNVQANADFITQARTDLPALVEEVERLQAALVERDAELVLLRNVLDNIPTHAYGEALREGAGAHGAWDCFREVLQEHLEAVRSCPAVFNATERRSELLEILTKMEQPRTGKLTEAGK